MKFEYCGSFRDRNKFPTCGKFEVKISQTANNKRSALDPVCESSPMISWKGGFVLNGTITSSSVLNEDLSEYIINIPGLNAQFLINNFLSGCLLAYGTFSLRIIESSKIDSTTLKILCFPNISLSIGSAVTITDYTDFSTMQVRAPTNFDFGKFKILYNENLNQFLDVINCDMSTRRLTFKQNSAPGWLPTHNLNLRDSFPAQLLTVVSSTSTTITLSTTLDPYVNIGDWLRIRHPDYAIQPETWSVQIVNIIGNTVTIFPTLTTPPIMGDTLELLPFSYDNAFPMQYFETYKMTEFKVKLESLSIPNVPILNSNLTTEPYLYVSLYNVDTTYSLKNLINTNNPYVPDAMWIAKLDPVTLKEKKLRFITTNVDQLPQKIVMDMKIPQILEIKTTNGEIFQTLQPDTKQPSPTWPELNLSAVFSFLID